MLILYLVYLGTCFRNSLVIIFLIKDIFIIVTDMMNIYACAMFKNESKRLRVTLDAAKPHVNGFIVFDTGSTDDTLDILREVIPENQLHIKQGSFVDFEVSRNVLLDFADKICEEHKVDYLLLLDCNDELQNGEQLQAFCKQYKDHPETAFLVNQEWWSGVNISYYNVRLIKPNDGWRYKGVVHEYIQNPKYPDYFPGIKVPNVKLYQDRTLDDDKTGKRFKRDKDLLYKSYRENPDNPRTVFYLAQTYECLGKWENAVNFYKIRAVQQGGFWEENYLSYYRIGNIMFNHVGKYKEFTEENIINYLLKAYETCVRVEPLILLSRIYLTKKKWGLAYTYSSLACKLGYPNHCILNVDKPMYEYERYRLLSLSAYYLGQFEEGLKAALKTFRTYKKEEDKKVIDMYLEKIEVGDVL